MDEPVRVIGEVKEGKSEAWQAEFYSKSYTEAQGGPVGSPTKYNYLVTVKNKKIEKSNLVSIKNIMSLYLKSLFFLAM